jgi:hypothetical protein
VTTSIALNQGTLQQQLLSVSSLELIKAFQRKHNVLVITLEISAAFVLLDKDKLKRKAKIFN